MIEVEDTYKESFEKKKIQQKTLLSLSYLYNIMENHKEKLRTAIGILEKRTAKNKREKNKPKNKKRPDKRRYWPQKSGKNLSDVFNNKKTIQVTYASYREEIEKREIKAMLKASKELKCKNLLMITWDYIGEETKKRTKNSLHAPVKMADRTTTKNLNNHKRTAAPLNLLHN